MWQWSPQETAEDRGPPLHIQQQADHPRERGVVMEFLKNERKQILYSIMLGLVGGLVGIALFGLSGYMISLSFFDPPFFVIILIIAVIKLFGMMKGLSSTLNGSFPMRRLSS